MLVDSKIKEPRNLIRLLKHTFARTIGKIIVILHTTYIVATSLVRGKNPHRSNRKKTCKLNVREQIWGNQEWTIQRNWQNLVIKTQDEDKQT